MTRATTKKARPGELRMFYGRLPDESSPDVVIANGEGVSRRDGHLLMWILCSERPPIIPGKPFDRSLIEELKSRDYDLSTLEFSIKKRSEP
jgi:hypothetical protein